MTRNKISKIDMSRLKEISSKNLSVIDKSKLLADSKALEAKKNQKEVKNVSNATQDKREREVTAFQIAREKYDKNDTFHRTRRYLNITFNSKSKTFDSNANICETTFYRENNEDKFYDAKKALELVTQYIEDFKTSHTAEQLKTEIVLVSDIIKKYEIFGTNYGDNTRNALRKLQKQHKIELIPQFNVNSKRIHHYEIKVL